MKSFFNNHKHTRVLLGVVSILAAAPAAACVGNQCPANTTTTNQPAPAARANGFSFGWSAVSQAGGAAEWKGDTGVANANKTGLLRAEANLNAAGDGCIGGCGSTNWNLKLHAVENVEATGTARSTTPGMTASVANTMAAVGSFGWVTQPTTSTATNPPR